MIRIVEVGPRDGLQNERVVVPTEVKARFVRALVDAALPEVEVTSFVSPKWIPQLADSAELLALLAPFEAKYSALVPNLKGLERGLSSGIQRIALFTAASEEFTKRNINMSIAESIEAFRNVVDDFRTAVPGGFVRAYVSTAFECPFAGKIQPQQVVAVAERLLSLGIDELSLGDTIGVAGPPEVQALTHAIVASVPIQKVAYHFHDTNGTAIANVAEALGLGVESFDSSAGGLGGCPYAPGAGGNLATEDLVYFLERSGIPTGVDLDKLARSSTETLATLGKAPASKAQQAALARLAPPPA